MAQTNYTPIILYNSGTTGNTPSTSNLASGELAINYTDGKLFYKDNSSTLQVIGWKTTPTTAGGTGLTSYTAGDLPYYASGSALSKLSIGTSGYVLESNGSAPTWVAQSTLSVGTATNATNTAITDNTSSSATWYPTIVSATTGNLPQTTSSTKLSFVPSTGTLTATNYSGAWVGSTIAVAYGGTGLTTFGPTFSARNSSNQSISSATFTKVTLDTKDFDPNTNFASSTFTPTIAGYYQINCTIRFNGVAITGAIIAIYKNGSAFTRVAETNSSIGTDFTLSGSAIVYCNGSTDYIEMYGIITGTSPDFNYANASACCRMSGSYVRGT